MLAEKTIVITGVASGIGQRCAQIASEMGAKVFGIDVVKPETTIGTFIQGDLSSQAGVSSILEALPNNIDALCNVAGVSGTAGANITLAINFFGLKELSEGVALKMNAGGSIVNVASMAGYGWRENTERASGIANIAGFPDIDTVIKEFSIPEELGYPISKEVLLVWNKVASQQKQFKDKGIRINAVSPGPVETPILAQFRQVLGEEKASSDINKVGRAGTPEDIAPVIMFLCSDAAKWVNGNNISTDGGLEAATTVEKLHL
ncbi:coniferyl-alcohol dehydrogenase [Marinomonas pollencensis]|uniref:NAD(P)-dependent dehydrogenase (Short-subunit alcohol dehydrogenase family) n=1 Tax=Marinomonas pollencensis TaxID=491954 RepID=A0A3E0DKJ3_9GAMM|nr:coniferyl-alcohol dehydrogenase [Marinomonas pollencensis]REG83217.1 NAD(P)-dependent dehydrogenase (short-subunit alcohol dehydrogenase family) [Marinomonas pollencensis]